MLQYIENINISFSITIYRIVSYRWKNIEFFDISRYLLYIAIFYAKGLGLYFYYCITKIAKINEENDKLTEAN